MTESMTEILKALRKARREFPPVVKDQENPFFHSKYAALDAIIRAVTPALDDNDLTLLAGFEVIEGQSALWMELHHDSGESLPKSTLLIPVKKTTKTDSETGEVTITEDNPQDVGSGISYMVRYSIKTYLGLPLGDDDGNRASGQRREDPEADTITSIKRGEEELCEVLGCSEADLRSEFFKTDAPLENVSAEERDNYLAHLRELRDSETKSVIVAIEKAEACLVKEGIVNAETGVYVMRQQAVLLDGTLDHDLPKLMKYQARIEAYYDKQMAAKGDVNAGTTTGTGEVYPG